LLTEYHTEVETQQTDMYITLRKIRKTRTPTCYIIVTVIFIHNKFLRTGSNRQLHSSVQNFERERVY